MDLKERKSINNQLKDELKDRKKSLNFSKILKELKTKDLPHCYYWEQEIYFIVIKYNDLSKLRKKLKQEFGTWKDNLEHISASWLPFKNDYKVSYRWEGKYKCVCVNIRLELLRNDLPEKLKSLKKGCEFKETIIKLEATETKKLDYICGLKE